MPLTLTQSKVLHSHLEALRHVIDPTLNHGKTVDFTQADVLSSMVFELGGFITPMIADAIATNRTPHPESDQLQIKILLPQINDAIDELRVCIDDDISPGRNFREIIAQLLEQLGPLIIQIIIGMLLEPAPTPAPLPTE